MIVFLVPIRQGRFELYSEAPEEAVPAPDGDPGRLRRWTHAAHLRWHALVDAARSASHQRSGEAAGASGPGGRVARWRDQLVCRLAESIAEQRTLWSLRKLTTATLHFPSSINAAQARIVLDRSLARARRHHGRWLIIDLLLFVASGILFFVPGPNIVAYYIAFRVLGHLNSWRGARQGSQQIAWTLEPNANLAELGSLVDLPGETRAPLVAEIAERLNLPRLTAFFARVAA
jgi:hypothetical protein